MKKSDFQYWLPEQLIAQYPLPERSASRLLCMDRSTGRLVDKCFNELLNQIDARDLLIFNDTKVIPARLLGKKTSGGKIEILIERVQSEQRALAHVRASKAPKSGTVIELEQGYYCTVSGRTSDLFQLEFPEDVRLTDILTLIGHVPLPPYIERPDNKADLDRYQTVFAKEAGAVAAPTAGLHFDLDMMTTIAEKGIRTAFVTLHVGSGTFQPVRVENLADHVMHREYFVVSQDTVDAVNVTKATGGRIIAIGTTAVRALESAAKTGRLAAGFGDTDLFITPGYRFTVVDAMVTNFHLPESTLLMLVAAFAGYEPVMAAYRHAVEKAYRFFSYGDAMFVG